MSATSDAEAASLFLKLAVAKSFIDEDLAKEVYQEAQRTQADPSAVMLARGLITQHQVNNLRKEVQKALGPKTIGGHRIVATLGSGGMGVVYRAVQLSMNREIALKVMDEKLARDPHFAERFLREAQTSARVNHPHVVTVFDTGRDGDLLYLAMELVTGGDVDQLCRANGGRLPARRAVEIIRDAAKGLVAVHEAGLIHRDIKPSNIFLTKDGAAKLADMGLSRQAAADDYKLTRPGQLLGTPAYMSPEQARASDEIDIRSDIYALGATLYHLVTGRPPFTGNSPLAIALAAERGPFPDPNSVVPDLPAAVAAVIRCCTKGDPAHRHQTPSELVADLEAILADPTLAGTPTHRATDAQSPGPVPGWTPRTPEPQAKTPVQYQQQQPTPVQQGWTPRPQTPAQPGWPSPTGATGNVPPPDSQATNLMGGVPLVPVNGPGQPPSSPPGQPGLGGTYHPELHQPPPGSAPPRPGPSAGKILAWIGLAILVLGVIGAGLWWLRYQTNLDRARDDMLAAINAWPSEAKGADEAQMAQSVADYDLVASDARRARVDAAWVLKRDQVHRRQEADAAHWLADNAKRPEVQTTPSGLQFEFISGDVSGPLAGPADSVQVRYTGVLTDGTQFDQSPGDSTTIKIADVQVKGLAEAFQLMHNGVKVKIYVPPALAYGEHGLPPTIGAYAVLGYTIEMVRVIEANPAPAPPVPAAAPPADVPAVTPPPPAPVVAAAPDAPWAINHGTDANGAWADIAIAGVTQRMRWIRPGTFTMGCPQEETDRAYAWSTAGGWAAQKDWFTDCPAHPVVLTTGFWIADTACTQHLWQAVMGSNPSKFTGDPDLPVESVSWYDVRCFLSQAGTTDVALALPSEAQWEYACRAGTGSDFWFGNDPEQLVKYGNSADQDFKAKYDSKAPFLAGNDGYAETAPVKAYPPNPWGMYGMHGNVSQWCEDWYGTYPVSASDPIGPAGSLRVARGGAWNDAASLCRAAFRQDFNTTDRKDSLGFRFIIRYQPGINANRPPFPAIGTPVIGAAGFIAELDQVCRDPVANADALKKAASALVSKGYRGGATDADVYIGQCMGALLNDDNHGGWPFRSSLVFEAAPRTAMIAELQRRIDAADDDADLLRYALIGPTVIDGTAPQVQGLINELATRSPYLAERALQTARSAGTFWKKKDLTDQLTLPPTGASASPAAVPADAGPAAPWAADHGSDAHGAWADLAIAGVTQRMRWIKPGRFTMGSSQEETDRAFAWSTAGGWAAEKSWFADCPAHPVVLTTGFWIADTACTQRLWQAVMGSNPAKFTGDPDLPVESVSWYDVRCFLSQAGTTDVALALPSEAQWEYACRAGTNTDFWFGNDPEQLVKYGNGVDQDFKAKYDSKVPVLAGKDGYAETAPVKAYPPNPWGMYGMHGNVSQWCEDWYGIYPASATDPIGPAGTQHVSRGGSWNDAASICRASFRMNYDAGERKETLGFRFIIRYQPGVNANRPQFPAIGTPTIGAAGFPAELDQVCRDPVANADALKKAASALVSKGYRDGATAADVYIGQCMGALLNEDDHGGWPFRSSLVFDAAPRATMVAVLQHRIDTNDVDADLLRYALIGPTVIDGTAPQVQALINELATRSPYLAERALQTARAAATFWKKKDLGDQLNLPPTGTPP